MIKKAQAVSALFGLCGGVIFTVLGMVLTQRTMPAPILIEPPPPTATPAPTSTPAPLQVYINGAVQNPAVYEMSTNSILDDLVQVAGGFTEDANAIGVNLALPLQNGMQVFIPSITETAAALPPVVSELAPVSENDSVSTLVNINIANEAELDILPGIGPSTAQKIIQFREANGPFQTKEELMLVSGIGEAKFQQVESMITVGE